MVSYDLLKELQMRPFFMSMRGVISNYQPCHNVTNNLFWGECIIRRPAVAGRCRAVCRGWFHKDGRRGPAIWWAARWNPASLRPFSVTAGCGLPKWILHISDELRHGVVSVLHPAFYSAKRRLFGILIIFVSWLRSSINRIRCCKRFVPAVRIVLSFAPGLSPGVIFM